MGMVGRQYPTFAHHHPPSGEYLQLHFRFSPIRMQDLQIHSRHLMSPCGGGVAGENKPIVVLSIYFSLLSTKILFGEELFPQHLFLRRNSQGRARKVF
jgi:hypothetical protein